MDTPRPADTQYWREVEDLFAAALEVGAAERPVLLERRCAGRPDLRADVDGLLASHEEAGSFIQPGTGGVLARARSGSGSGAPDDQLGTRAGAFRLIEKVAEGGMGAVYRAERAEGGFEQAAAVKLIASRLHTAELLRRFNAERQILASLQHPNVVALLDGGVTPTGQPFIAMELVGGLPITEYCADRRLPLGDRIRLFLQVCAAVGFAHRQLVVHRDLKPGNVFVTRDGLVKVLDFGIAKLLEPDEDLVAATVGPLGPLTAGYASPEQLRGSGVGTASDVYSLGVLLYELLAGRRPYETAGKALDAVLEVVLHDNPPPPSTAPRGSLPYDAATLRGDLDAIVLKAMAKEPERRYTSAEDLADDLRRHLERRPVRARPAGRAYVAGRFVRRHRTAAAATVVAVVAVLGGLGASLWQARVARAERDRATSQMRTAQQTMKFLSGIFENANPASARGRTLTARDLLDAGAVAIERELAGQPEAQAALLVVMARAYMRQEQLQKALDLAERSLALREGSQSARPEDLAESVYLVGSFRRRLNRYADAIPLLRRSVELSAASRGPDDALVTHSLRDLSVALRGLGQAGEARALLDRAIAIEERARPDSAHLALCLNSLGNLLAAEGDLSGARAALERSIAAYERSDERGTWSSALPMLSLGDVLRQLEDFEAARPLFERALALDDETYGRQSRHSAWALARLGELALAAGDLQRARELLAESSRIWAATDPQAATVYVPRGFTGLLRVAEGRPAEALPLLASVVAHIEKINGPRHPDLAKALVDLSLAQRALAGPGAAEATLKRALAIQREALDPSHPALPRTLTALAEAVEAQGRREEARGLAEEAARVAASLPAGHSERVKAEASVARFRGR